MITYYEPKMVATWRVVTAVYTRPSRNSPQQPNVFLVDVNHVIMTIFLNSCVLTGYC